MQLVEPVHCGIEQFIEVYYIVTRVLGPDIMYLCWRMHLFVCVQISAGLVMFMEYVMTGTVCRSDVASNNQCTVAGSTLRAACLGHPDNTSQAQHLAQGRQIHQQMVIIMNVQVRVAVELTDARPMDIVRTTPPQNKRAFHKHAPARPASQGADAACDLLARPISAKGSWHWLCLCHSTDHISASRA